ncbi:MAG: response regulator [Candidatus Kariarchaeaceae archaeon]
MSRKVLVVDDEVSIRDVVCKMLTIKGHQPTAVSSGDEAVTEVHNDNYEFVILDLNMPGTLSGTDTFYRLREEHPKIKVVISTGMIDLASATKFQKHGVHGILEKPYKFDDLLDLIQ